MLLSAQRLLLAFLIAAFGFGYAPSHADTASAIVPGKGDPILRQILYAYTIKFLRNNPTTSTYLGGSGLDASLIEADGKLRDYSVQALKDEDDWLAETQKKLQGITPETLSADANVDRNVALAQIAFMLRQHQVRRLQESAIDTYIVEPFRAIDAQLQGIQQNDNKVSSEDWSLLINRVKSIPRFLATTQEQLLAGVKSNNTPDRRMIKHDGLDATAANSKYFSETLPAQAAKLMGRSQRKLLADLKRACAEAGAAYRNMHDFILATFYEKKDGKQVKASFMADNFAIGETEYDWALKNNFHIEKTSAQLYQEASPIIEDTRQQIVKLAREIGKTHRWQLLSDDLTAVQAVFERLKKDYPKSDATMVAWYRATAFRLVDYGRRTKLFDVPAEYKLQVLETPEPLRASTSGSAYYPAPAFKNNGQGRFYVSPTNNNAAELMNNNRAALADLAAHEGFPGHDWYFKVLAENRNQISPIRWLTPGSVEDSSSMWADSMSAEGWALYAEALISEPRDGAPNGFYTPEERLYQLQGKLYRDLRVRIDTGIHTGRMTYDEAVTQYSEILNFLPGSCAESAKKSKAKEASCRNAEGEIYRYSKWPTQAITYRLGKDEIYSLRTQAAKLLGEKFSLKTFHLLFIRQGTIPSSYFGERLLDELKEAK